MFPHYFEACGTNDDLVRLNLAHRYWYTLEKKRTSFWEVPTSVLGNIEESLRILRVKLILQNARE